MIEKIDWEGPPGWGVRSDEGHRVFLAIGAAVGECLGVWRAASEGNPATAARAHGAATSAPAVAKP